MKAKTIKRTLSFAALVSALIFLNPARVWELLIRRFPSTGYESFCILVFVSLCLLYAWLIAAGICRNWFKWRWARYFLIGFVSALTVSFCKDINRHFLVAVLHGNLTTAELMLHMGADINAKDSKSGKTPLQEVLTMRLSPEAAGAFDAHRQGLATWLISHGAMTGEQAQD